MQELDEKQYVSLRLVLCELKNHYVSSCFRYFPLGISVTELFALFLVGHPSRLDHQEPGEDQEAAELQRREYVLVYTL